VFAALSVTTAEPAKPSASPAKGGVTRRAEARAGRRTAVSAQTPRRPARVAGRRGRQAGAPSTRSREAGFAQLPPLLPEMLPRRNLRAAPRSTLAKPAKPP
jgi:hypothetical protein